MHFCVYSSFVCKMTTLDPPILIRKFLDFSPWSNYSFFRSYVPFISVNDFVSNYPISFITLPFLNRDPKAIEIVQASSSKVFYYDAKRICSTATARKIVELPAKEVLYTF